MVEMGGSPTTRCTDATGQGRGPGGTNWTHLSILRTSWPALILLGKRSHLQQLMVPVGQWADKTIAPKELVPIVIALALRGPQWAGEKVCALCNNMAVVCAAHTLHSVCNLQCFISGSPFSGGRKSRC